MNTKNIILAILGIALIFIIVALSGKRAVPADEPNDNPSGIVTDVSASALANDTWVWEKTDFEDGTTMTPNRPNAFKVTFTKEGNVSGTTDCNSWGSTFTLGSGGTIRLTPIVSTLMFCADSQETPYLSGIEGADKINFAVNGDLLLTIEVDDVGPISIMTFKKDMGTVGQQDWKTHASAGKTFSYPADLGTKYVSLQDWPPTLNIDNNSFACVEAGSEIERAGAISIENINDRVYCVTKVSEGAAGSTYTQYAYARAAGNLTEIMTFTLKSVQCGNYDEPKKSECEAERAAFDPGKTVDQIFQTVK